MAIKMAIKGELLIVHQKERTVIYKYCKDATEALDYLLKLSFTRMFWCASPLAITGGIETENYYSLLYNGVEGEFKSFRSKS